MRNKKSAFSLIEISIVVLIIGILVAGITQSSRLISSSKIATAQTLTQSSPITSNKGLMLWLETSSEASFASSESSNGAAVTVWNDINSQSTSKLFARTNAAGLVTYKAASPIGGLPSLYFAASTTGMTLSAASASAVASPIVSAGFTFFTVYKEDSNAAHSVFYNGSATTNGWGFMNNGASIRNVQTGTTNHVAATTLYGTNATISSGTFDGTNIELFTNGASDTLTAATAAVATATTGMYIGSKDATTTGAFLGYISEIVIFDSALRDDDRKAIEAYLGKKYGIKVS
jgi:prepilin-type N-terminal cleavage/methylation domain-containing protein